MTQFVRPRAVRRSNRLWRLALALALTSLPRLAEAAADDTAPASITPPVAAESTAPAASSAEATIRYQVVVEAPTPLRDTLVKSVDLIRWQTYADMTEDLFDRLAREAIDQTHDAAATEGFFSPDVDIKVDRTTQPVTVTLHVDSGIPTRIGSVTIDVTGPAANDEEHGAPAVKLLRDQWLLPRDAVFRQQAWDAAKDRAVATLSASPYAAAKLSESKAEIDPEARSAALSVTLASGPPFRFGAFRVTGLSRYSEALVQNYSGIAPGEFYSLAALDQYMRRLNGTGYFASVHAAVDTETTTPEDAPVDIAVIEAPPKKLEAGIGFSTDTQFRSNISYRDVNFAGQALQFSADARVESKVQTGALQLVQPPDRAGWSTAWFLRDERTDISGLVTKTVTAGGRRTSLDERNQWQYGAAYVDDRQEPDGGDKTNAHALYVDGERAWRRVDDLLSPTRGYMAVLQAGFGVPGASSMTFGRVVGHIEAWYPIDRDNSLTARAEGGIVFASTRDKVPTTMRFRTGGDTTVRGYAFDSLGVQQGNATLPGRYYTVTSVELTHWINATWGVAAFVDAGNAFDTPSAFHLAVGYGAGARVRTPIGPFRLDLAYGQETKQVRLHFSVGVTF